MLHATRQTSENNKQRHQGQVPRPALGTAAVMEARKAAGEAGKKQITRQKRNPEKQPRVPHAMPRRPWL